MTDIVELAKEFAYEAHEGQTRKNSGLPYFVHPCHVVDILRSHGIDDPSTLAAAYLHDVIEDCDVTIEAIAEEFGDEVATLVIWVTNPSTKAHGNRDTRKMIDRTILTMAPVKSKNIKLGDIISNLSDIEESDPDFAKTYMSEKARMIHECLVCEGIHQSLLDEALGIVNDYFK